MSKFKLTKTFIDDLVVIEPTVFGDSRGYFMETYNKKDFEEIGINANFIQDNQSKSVKNVLRGLHFQTNYPQAKLVRVIAGEVFDVAVDLRKDSKTYGKWFGVLLSSENKKQFFIPRGFAHGFAVISDTAEFVYKCDNLYDPSGEGGVIWNDEDLNINWGDYIDLNNIILSEKDKNQKKLKELLWKVFAFYFLHIMEKSI